MMIRVVAHSPTSSCPKIKAYFSQKGIEISLKTISRHICDQFDLKSYKPAQKPHLTPQMKMKHLVFAKKYESRTAENWG